MRIFYFMALLIICSFLKANAQDVATEIKPVNKFDVSIIQVYPDSFPHVSVVFQAKNYFGEPLWLVEKEDLSVVENGKACEVIAVRNISINKPLNIGLVFDHSGSMIENPSQMPLWIGSANDVLNSGGSLPKGYKMAIDYAKNGVLEFLSNTESSNDSVLFVGFSSTVDKVYPLTKEFDGIKAFVRDVPPIGGTSFYDALYVAISGLKGNYSKSVIVALTDGRDNESSHHFNDVIDYANQHHVSIYIIGLGDVYEYPLKLIAEQTSGFYYYTESASKLVDIYHNAQKQLKSIYQLDYISGDIQDANPKRETRFTFKNDTMTFSDHAAIIALPEEVIARLEELNKRRLQTLAYAGVGLVVVSSIGIGLFVVRRNKKQKKQLRIDKVFPNPFGNELVVHYSAQAGATGGELIFRNKNGRTEKTIPLIGSGQIQIDASRMKNGPYFLQIISKGQSSEIVKVIKQ